MKKIFTLFAAILCGLALNAKTIYLNTGGSELWEKDGANHFAVWHWQGTGEGVWTGWMTQVAGNVWSVEIADASDMVIFCRFNNAASEPAWGTDMWNQTPDLTLPTDKDCFTITSWSNGEWSVYEGGTVTPPGPQPGGAKDYLLKGWCNGKDIETPTAEELFEDGTLTYEFTGDATFHKGYFFILVCEPGQVIGEQYMTKGVDDPSGTHTTLYKDGFEKFGVPEGTVTFYLYDNGDGTFELSTEPLAGKTLVGGGDQAIENTRVSNKAYKTIINGQLVIIRGEKMFDATGRQL